jgi:hypothetical protein
MKKSIFTLFIIAFAMTGCNKDQSEVIPPSTPTFKSDASSELLKFDDAEDFFETLELTASFDNTERTNWEDAQDFVSFGRACDEFYFSLNETIFEDDETVEEFVKSNSDKLQLIEDGNSEFSLETVLFKQDFRYFANKDKMFQIGDIVYLILEDGTVSADYSKIGKLKEINENNYFSFINDDDVSFSSSLTNTNRDLKDGTYNCGVWQEQRVTNNRERTYLRISIHTTDVGNGTNQYVNYLVRPYKKTIGIWYWCSRHISCNIKVAADYKVYTSSSSWTWVRVNGSYACTDKYASSVSGNLCSQWISTGFQASPAGHFGGYNCWADTPSTNPNVVLQANTFLCP